MKEFNVSREELRRRVLVAVEEGVSVLVDPRQLLGILDRLRAAEEVLASARNVALLDGFGVRLQELRDAIRRYDEATKE